VLHTVYNSIEPFAVRAVLKKEGCEDVRFELRRNSAFDLTIYENNKSIGIFWRVLTPVDAMRGGRVLTLQEAWRACLAKRYPGYTPTDCEEGFRRDFVC